MFGHKSSRRGWWILALLVGAAALLVGGCATQVPPTPAPTAVPQAQPTDTPAPAVPTEIPKGGKLVWAVTQDVTNFDPAQTSGYINRTIMQNIYETLIKLDHDYVIKPGLATRWESSEDGKSWTFYLREGVKFHDGTAFNAAAVCAAYDRATDPDFKAGPVVSNLAGYESCEAVDELTVIIRLKVAAPEAGFLRNMADGYVGVPSPTAVEKYGEDFPSHPVGTGPFMFKEYVAGDHITLLRFPDYNWAPEEVFDHKGPAYLEEIVIRPMLEEATRVVALEAGEVHLIERVPFADVGRLKEDARFVVFGKVIPGMPQGSFMNVTLSPLDELDVRRAILYALDREGIINSLYFGLVQPAYGPICNNQPEYNPDLENMYTYDLEKAAALLEAAGWMDTDGDGAREKDGERLFLSVDVVGWAPWQEALASTLDDLGFEMELRNVPTAQRQQDIRECLVHISPMGSVHSDPSGQMQFWHSSNVGKIWVGSCHSDAAIDSLLNEALVELDPDKRIELWRDFQVRVMEQALYIPIYPGTDYTGHSVKVQGLKNDGTGAMRWFYDTYVEP